VFLLLALQSSCSGYTVVPTTLNITNVSNDSKQALLDRMSAFLKAEGFDDLGKDKEMIALFEKMDDKKDGVGDLKRTQLTRLNRELNFYHAGARLRLVWADYVDSDIPRDFPYSPPAKHFIEIQIFEERPGGFSANGLRVYNRLVSILRAQVGNAVVVIKGPVRANEADDSHSVLVDMVGLLIAYALSLCLSLFLTGGVSVYLLKKSHISHTKKRIIFVLVNAWLCMPIPLPVAFTDLLWPNLFAFPWLDVGYYQKLGPFFMVSLLGAVAVCSVVSMVKFRRVGEVEEPGEVIHS